MDQARKQKDRTWNCMSRGVGWRVSRPLVIQCVMDEAWYLGGVVQVGQVSGRLKCLFQSRSVSYI